MLTKFSTVDGRAVSRHGGGGGGGFRGSAAFDGTAMILYICLDYSVFLPRCNTIIANDD
jgi:hypothetical protein